jgi:hypothetical protein
VALDRFRSRTLYVANGYGSMNGNWDVQGVWKLQERG